MSKLLLLLIVFFIYGCDNGFRFPEKKNTHFIGTIEYAYTYSSDSLNADSLTRTRPGKSILRYDTVNYQSKFIGPDTMIYYYSGLHNKSLSETNHQRNYECEDYGSFTDSVISYRFYFSEEKILGHSCKVLEIQKENSWVQYFVSDEFRISPSNYRLHRSYNWDFYGEKANGGLILKSEHRFKYFTMRGIATAVKVEPANFKALEIDEKIFSEFCR